MVNKSKLLETTGQLMRDKRIEGISNLRDESDTLLLHQDIVLLFQILPSAVGRLLIQMQPMPLCDVKQNRPVIIRFMESFRLIPSPFCFLIHIRTATAEYFQ